MDIDSIQSAAALVRRRRRAFTIVEVLLALAITGLVSAAVAAMLVATSYGTSSEHDLHGVVVKSEVVGARLGAAIRSSREVHESGTGYVLLWTTDANTNGTADRAEIRLIDFDSGNGRLNNHYDDGASGAYVDVSTFRGVITPEVWATGVTAASFATDAAAPNTRLVSYRLTLQAGNSSETVVGAASPRYTALN